ncbi:DnaB-like helicase N-terminal domain-containing protein, partial [Acinetobacter baumannii]
YHPSHRDEETIIATVIEDPRLLRAASQVKTQDFLDPDLAIIWHSVLTLANSGQPITLPGLIHLTPDQAHNRLKRMIVVPARGYEPLRQAVTRV